MSRNTQDTQRVDPAKVLSGKRPWAKIQNLTDEHVIRTCLKHEANSATPRQPVIAKLNARLDELRKVADLDPGDLQWGEPPSYDEALSIAQHFNGNEIRGQLRAERECIIPGVDEPRETVIRALEARLTEVTPR